LEQEVGRRQVVELKGGHVVEGEKNDVEVVVVSFVVVSFQTAVNSSSSDQRGLEDACWASLASMRRLPPSQNAWVAVLVSFRRREGAAWVAISRVVGWGVLQSSSVEWTCVGEARVPSTEARIAEQEALGFLTATWQGCGTQEVNGGLPWVQTASLVLYQGCRTRAAAKRLVLGVSGARRVAGAGTGGGLRALEVCFIVLQLQLVVQRGVESGVESSTTNTLSTWQFAWMHGAS
jgi:hypothetical protein